MSRARWAPVALAALSFALGVGAVVAMLGGEHNQHRGLFAVLTLVIGWGFTATGIYAWRRRPESNIGPLMIAIAFAAFAKGFAFSNDSLVFTVGSVGEVLIYAFLVHLLLSFPSGRLEGRTDRILVAIGYFNATVVQLTALVLTDPVQDGCANCPDNLLLIDHAQAARVILALQLDTTIALFGAVVALLYKRWRESTASQRQAFAPVLTMGGLSFVILMTEFIVEQSGLSGAFADGLTVAVVASLACLPFAFLAGLVRSRFGRGEAVAAVVGKLGEETPRVALRDTLAEALGDPELELAYWVPKTSSYVDSDGRPVTLPDERSGRITTEIEHDGRPVAAIIHDASLEDDPDLVRTVSAAAALTLRNEQLDAELRAKVAELRASRMRIVQAGDEQRRRIERDLHDGAQQRLMAVGINLRLVRDRINDNPEGAAELLDTSLQELGDATAELRELARGIHPAVLTDRGLAAAIKGLAGRSPVPVQLVETPADRLPPPVESAVYFVVAEALTNAARYAGADLVSVSVVRDNGTVEVEVADDGVGGADPDQGSGLRGLHDRVAALDGDLDLSSADGEGTTLKATIPCG